MLAARLPWESSTRVKRPELLWQMSCPWSYTDLTEIVQLCELQIQYCLKLNM